MSIADTFPNGLRVPQVVGALKIQEQRRLLLADQPGAGKTAQALVALELDGMFQRESTILITTMMTACQLTWAGELERRVASQYEVVIADLTLPKRLRNGRLSKTMPSVAEREQLLAAARVEAAVMGLPLVVLANFELLRQRIGRDTKIPTLWDIQWDALLIDESHLVLPTKEDQWRKMTQFWYGLSQLDIAPNAIRVSMTGTPDRGKLENRYGHWKFLMPNSYKDFWSWARAHFVVTPGEWGGAEIGKLRRPDHWQQYEHHHMLRRTKAEMLEGLPPKQWAGDGGIDLPMTPSQATAYEDYQDVLEQRAAELLASDDEKDQKRGQALRLQFSLRARQMATCTWQITETEDEEGRIHSTGTPIRAGREGSNKLAWVLDWLEARGYTPDNWDASLGKVVITSFFTEVLDWLRDELAAEGIHAEVMKGATSQQELLSIEERFQRGDLRIVLLSAWLGVSINLDAADDMIFIDSVHDPDRMEQTEDRIHRASRNHQVTYWRLASIDTADIAVLQTLDSRYMTTRKMYDGSRGVEFARRMMPELRGATAA